MRPPINSGIRCGLRHLLSLLAKSEYCYKIEPRLFFVSWACAHRDILTSIVPLLSHSSATQRDSRGEWRGAVDILTSFCPELRRWHICGLLGRGSFGVVFDARCRKTKKHIALKFLPNAPLDWFDSKHEADMTAELSSFGIAFGLHGAVNLEARQPTPVLYGCDLSLRRALEGGVSVLVLERVDITVGDFVRQKHEGDAEDYETMFVAFDNFIARAQDAPAAHNDAKLNNLGVTGLGKQSLRFGYIDCGRALTNNFLLGRGMSAEKSSRLIDTAKRADLIALDASVLRHMLRISASSLLSHSLSSTSTDGSCPSFSASRSATAHPVLPCKLLSFMHETLQGRLGARGWEEPSMALVSRLEREHAALMKEVKNGVRSQ
jgi:hypothetical protein